jgi:hypothetical protein
MLETSMGVEFSRPSRGEGLNTDGDSSTRRQATEPEDSHPNPLATLKCSNADCPS